MVLLRGEKIFHATPIRRESWYLLGVLLQIFVEHPRPFYMGDLSLTARAKMSQSRVQILSALS